MREKKKGEGSRGGMREKKGVGSRGGMREKKKGEERGEREEEGSKGGMREKKKGEGSRTYTLIHIPRIFIHITRIFTKRRERSRGGVGERPEEGSG